MKITIIGWYGTETIGDRAILAGLISFFNKSFDNFEIKLGSLYPFFSDRTINEDYSFYKEIIGKDFKVDIFNSKNSKELLEAIQDSDLTVMGGGPLMDLSQLFMVEYAFKKARSFGVKTALLGCGVGPLFRKKYRKSVLEISKNSDLIILRDSKARESLEEIYKEFRKNLDSDLLYTSFDPAVECILKYNAISTATKKDYIAVNLREFPLEYTKNRNFKNINEDLKEFIYILSNEFSNREILLIPMHYFHLGGDDRIFLNSIALQLNKSNLNVQNEHLTLKQTIEVYQNAYFNVGMRFHSVLFQAISSGKNYILDYTEPKKGKIYGFLKDIDKNAFYNDRYFNIQEDKITVDIIKDIDKKFCFDENYVKKKINIYHEKLKELKYENPNS